jgi:hypothetical protein
MKIYQRRPDRQGAGFARPHFIRLIINGNLEVDLKILIISTTTDSVFAVTSAGNA